MRAISVIGSETGLGIVEPHGFYSRGPSGFFGEIRRSMASFAKASEDTRCAFLHGFTAEASCVGG